MGEKWEKNGKISLPGGVFGGGWGRNFGGKKMGKGAKNSPKSSPLSPPPFPCDGISWKILEFWGILMEFEEFWGGFDGILGILGGIPKEKGGGWALGGTPNPPLPPQGVVN